MFKHISGFSWIIIFPAFDISRYLDDVPRLEGELYGGLVLSQHAHAIISVDASAALAMEGVVDYVSVSDVPGDNMIGLSHFTLLLLLVHTTFLQERSWCYVLVSLHYLYGHQF